MKKIMYVIEDITVMGGCEKITLKKAIEFVKKGYEVSICCHSFKTKELLLKYPDINFIRLELNDNYSENKFIKKLMKIRCLKNLRKQNKLKKYLEMLQIEVNKLQPDILIVFYELGIKKYWELETQGKKILEIHESYDYYIDNAKKEKNPIKKIIKKFKFYLKRKIMKKFDSVIILSESDAKKWKLDNVIKINNSIERKEKIEIVEEFKEKRFLSAGRLETEKGYDILVEVWKKIVSLNNEIKIDVFGEGSEKEKLVKMISENKLEKNILLNDFTNTLEDKYKSYYAYILPSRFECFSMVTLESLNNGVPVVAFDLEGGVKEMITNNKEGILIKKYDVDEMAKKIIELYDDEGERRKMSINSVEKSKKFTDEKIIKQWIELFES